MYILLDIGNTRMKASIADDQGIHPAQQWEEHLAQAEKVLVSNVAGPNAIPSAVKQHPRVHSLNCESPQAHRWIKGIPQGMGSDRISADIGARSIYNDRPLLIIDAGTCLTFDVIDSDGTYLGGAISPGISLRLRAMHEHTAALPLLDINGDHPVLGYDTPSAMRSGAINGLRWEIEGYIRHILSTHPRLHVFFTGGDCTDFPSDLQSIITIDPLLVQKGLIAAFKEEG